MPKLEDLPEIKKKIQKSGDELNILKNKNIPYNDTPLPEKAGKIADKGDSVKKSVKEENLDDLLSDIRDDFKKGNELKEEDTLQELAEFTDENISENEAGKEDDLGDLLEDISADSIKKKGTEPLDDFDSNDLASLLGGDDGSKKEKTEDAGDIPDNLDDLLKDTGTETEEAVADAGSRLPDELGMLNETEEAGEKIEDEGLDNLLSGLGGDSGVDQNMPDNGLDLDNLIKGEKKTGKEKPSQDEYITDTGDLSDLMIGMEDKKGTVQKKEDSENLDNLLKDLGGASSGDINQDQGMDELNALLGEPAEEKEEAFETGKEEQGTKEEEFVLDESLADLAGEIKEEELKPDNEAGYILEKTKQDLEKDAVEGGVLPDENVQDESFDHILETPLESAGLINDKILADDDFLQKEKAEESDALKGLEDFSMLEEESAEAKNKAEEIEKPSAGSSLDFESLDSLGDLSFETFPTEGITDKKKVKQPPPEFQDSSYGKIPEELSKQEIKEDQDISLKFTEDERKQIVLSLTNLPKQAEIKISKAIISNKYSNQQMKPLLYALIDGESAASIIKYYEKITGDKSLSTAEALRKFKGEKFEEMQKSFGYLIQKNLLPILVRVIAAAIVILIGYFAIKEIVIKNITAYAAYNNGLKKIDQKQYWEAEKFFEEGFNTQPSFNAVLKYARKYREHKRNLEAEKKYEHAINWRPERRDIVLEYADFFRETRSFERAEKKYKDLLRINSKDAMAMLGLAKTYYDWSSDNADKLLDAEDIYKDVLTIDNKNKDALFGNLNVYLKMKNHHKIMAQYSYISKTIKGKGDPEIFANLAEYLNDRHDFTYIKEVITKAYKSVKKNQYIPEIDYQNARYKKSLNIFDEEKKHLESSLDVFDRMKTMDQEKYESKKYQNLLSRVYNDLGENYDRKEPASIDAEKYYNKAIQTDPDYGVPYYNLGNFSYYNKKNDAEAKNFYELAEQKGFANDRLDYNLAKIYFDESEYYDSFLKINRLMDKFDYNSKINFMAGTIYYKMKNYDLAESLLNESYFNISGIINKKGDLLNIEDVNDKELILMMMQVSNNLGATFQKKYEKTKNASYLVRANKYYSDAILRYVELYGTETTTKENPQLNLRMVLYPYSGVEEPYIYDRFPDNYQNL